MIRFALLIASVLVTQAACGKPTEAKDEKPPPPAPTPSIEPDDEEVAEPIPSAPAPVDPTEEKGFVLMEGLSDVFVANGEDCEKLAAAILSFRAEHKADYEEVEAYANRMTLEQRREMQKRRMDRLKPVMDKMGPGMRACMGHEGFKKAMNQQK
jgi:hypothetical protein